MGGFAEYEQYDALGLADLVRRKEVTPSELLEAAIERVEARNPARAPGPDASRRSRPEQCAESMAKVLRPAPA
jgi:Asp-tRNA(Asn)/Glu-tRNA(Gln) amidotransferase A subunit family amidase